MKIINKKIKDLIFAEYNPRKLTTEEYQNLKDSLVRFGVVDPVIINNNKNRKNILIGGHQRVRVWQDLNNKTIPAIEINLPYEKERELNIRLNKNTGSWDWDIMANEFDLDELKQWGFDENDGEIFSPDDLIEMANPYNSETENKFSEFLDESNNYIVLFFKNDIDWLQAQTHFNLETVSSKRQNGKEWSSGIGRVINGSDAIKKLLSAVVIKKKKYPTIN